MASGFPGSIDSFTNPLTTSPLNSPSHAGQHQDLNDAVNKIETYMGLTKVIPSAATGTGVSLSASGTITFSSSSTITVTTFSALYDNYRLEISNVTGSTPLDIRFQLSGVTTGVYNQANVYVNTSSTVTGYGVAGNTYSVCGGADVGNANSMSIDIFGPFTTNRTAISGHGFFLNGSMLIGSQIVDTNSRSGFVLTTSTGTISGTLRIYGYRN
jgi:hypothetical protein